MKKLEGYTLADFFKEITDFIFGILGLMVALPFALLMITIQLIPFIACCCVVYFFFTQWGWL